MEITHKILLETNKGNITLGLYGKETPVTTANFVKYVEAGFYSKLLFHRVIEDFMIQGGGMIVGLFPKKDLFPPIKLEIAPQIKHEKYTLSMARTSDPNSATCQFFINLKDNGFLNHTSPTPQGWGYAVFGKVVEGMDVVDAIAKVATGNHGPHADVPREPVSINQATVVE